MQNTKHQPMESVTNRRSFIHHMATKILFISTLTLSVYCPITHLYLSERLSNSLLNKKSNIAYTDVYNANIFKPNGDVV